MNKLNKIFAMLMLIVAFSAQAQVKIGSNPTTILSGSLLELESNNKALTLPRMSDTEMKAIVSPVAGMFVYNNTCNCVYQRVNNKWKSMCETDCGSVDFTGGDPNLSGTTFTPNSPMLDCATYYGDNGTVWEWDPTTNTYVNKVPGQGTEWYLLNSTYDALSNKTRLIRRPESVVIGMTSWAGSRGFAVGLQDTASGNYSIAGGEYSVASGRSSIAVGNTNLAKSNFTVALGNKNIVSGIGSAAIGTENHVGISANNFAYGFLNVVTGGGGAAAIGARDSVTAIGWALGAENKVSAAGAVTIGSNCVATYTNGIAIGTLDTAAGRWSLALGRGCKSSNDFAFSMGNYAKASGPSSVAFGTDAVSSGPNSYALGSEANTGGQFSYAIGRRTSTVNFNNSVALGTNALASANTQFTAAFTNYQFFTNATMTTGVSLAAGSTSWSSISDRRSKKNIETIGYGLAEVMKLKPSIYNYIGAEGKSLGFIAQEIKEVIPEIIDQTTFGETKDYLAVRYSELIPVLTKAIQEQQLQIEELKAQIKSLQNNQK